MLKIFLLLVLTVLGLSLIAAPTSHASYNPSNLISDAVFTNANTMTANQIQDFLASKGSGLAKKSWSGKRAADIIYQAAQDWGINPQVILGTLQKEQSLVTDPSPDSIQLRSAMGYGCPDNGSCSSDYSGFSYQVNNGTWQLRFNFERASGDTSWYNPSISYACNGKTGFYSAALLPGKTVTFYGTGGGSNKTITIANAATASMYCYTPHVGPIHQTGYSGSYNFVTSFESWFGSTQAEIGMTDIEVEDQPFTDAPTTVKFSITNYTKTTLNLGTMGVAARDPNGANTDFSYVENITVKPGKTYNYTSTGTLNGAEGEYHFFIGRYANSAWHTPTFNDYNQTGSGDIYKDIGKKPTLTSSLQVNPTSIHKNQQFTGSFTIKNNSATYSLNLSAIGVAVRDAKSNNYDLPFDTNVTIAAGQTYTYSESRTLSTGTYHFWIASSRGSYGWSDSFPDSTSGITRTIDTTVKDQVTVTSGINIDPGNGHAGATATGMFTIKNFGNSSVNIQTIGIAARNQKNQNYDLPFDTNVTIAAGQTYTYSKSRTLPAGTYHFWIANYRNTTGWVDNYPSNENGSVVRTADTTIKEQITVTAGLNMNMGNGHAGATATGTFTIKNFGTAPVNLGTIGVAVRDTKNKNYDLPFDTDVTIAAGQEYTYSKTKVLPAGTYHFWIANYRNTTGWVDNYPSSESGGVVRTTNSTMKDQVTVTSSLTVDNGDGHAGDTVTGMFTIKNFGNSSVNIQTIGIAARNQKNQNYDLPFDTNVTIAAGQTYTYSKSRTLPAGTYHFWIANYRNTTGWVDNYPSNENGSVVRTADTRLE